MSPVGLIDGYQDISCREGLTASWSPLSLMSPESGGSYNWTNSTSRFKQSIFTKKLALNPKRPSNLTMILRTGWNFTSLYSSLVRVDRVILTII